MTEVEEHLITAYRAADYKVCDGEERFVLRIAECFTGLAALYRRTRQTSALFITACNPDGEEQDESRNKVAQGRLLIDLRARTGASNSDRDEFLQEAVALAPSGVVSLLVDSPQARPGFKPTPIRLAGTLAPGPSSMQRTSGLQRSSL